MKQGFTPTDVPLKEEINTNDIVNHPLTSKLIRGSREIGLKRGYIRSVTLPENGIYADDGFLFHHVSSEPRLNSLMIWRLREHGISYKYNKRFTPEEDEIIRNNWKEFADDYNIPMNDVLVYAGVGDHEKEYIPQEVIDRKYFCENTNFWPRMCKGLDCRSGSQIKLRMKIIFHESILNGAFTLQYGRRNGRTLQLADLINYVEAYPKCKYIQQESVKAVGINLAKLKSIINHYLYRASHGKVERKHWKCLWNTVDRLVHVFPITKSFGQIYRKAIMRRDRSELARLTKSINFRIINNILLKSLQSCKEAWNEITEDLLNEYSRAYDRLKIGKDAFDEAYDKVCLDRAFISPDRYSLFLRLLLKCVKDNAVSKTKMKKRYFHMDRLANMMLDYGISGFHVFDPSMSEVECAYSYAKINISECDKELPSNLSCTFTIKEKIRLFTTAYDAQFRYISRSANLYTIEGEDCNRKYVITKDGFPCIKIRNYHRVVFKYLESQRLDDDDSDISDEEDLSS